MGKSPAQLAAAVEALADTVGAMIEVGQPQHVHDRFARYEKRWKAEDDKPEKAAAPSGPTTAELQTQVSTLQHQVDQLIAQRTADDKARDKPKPPPEPAKAAPEPAVKT